MHAILAMENNANVRSPLIEQKAIPIDHSDREPIWS